MPRNLHFEKHGNGHQELIICNGLSQSTSNWRGITRHNAHFDWTLFDARGMGKSPPGPRPYSLDDHVEDLLHVMEETQARAPFLLGFSHGARVALRAAATQAGRFSGLILVSCASRRTEQRRAFLESWQQSLKMGGVRAMAWASLPNIVGPKILQKFADFEFLINGTVARNSEEGLEAMLEGMAGYPEQEQDAIRVSLPTLVLRGTEDNLVSYRDQKELCNWIHGAQARVFKDCGHTLPLEEPELFIKEIADFIDSI